MNIALDEFAVIHYCLIAIRYTWSRCYIL